MTPRDRGGWAHGPLDAITDVAGIRVGHWTDAAGGTGCTVVLCEGCTVAAADVRGGAPGTREVDVLGPANVVRRCDAVVLAGGSAFGLAAADGVMGVLRARKQGFPTRHGPVPIVPAAILFDLGAGSPTAFPNAAAGRQAALAARGGGVEQGNVGAGTGATVAKLLGAGRAMKGGLGTASVTARGFTVGAIAAVNAVGHIVEPDSGRLIAGPRAGRRRFTSVARAVERFKPQPLEVRESTVIVCVATDAALDHAQAQRMAIEAHDGLARSIVPSHTLGDGDVVFAVAMGLRELAPGDSIAIGAMAARAVERAVITGVEAAETAYGYPGVKEWRGG